MLLIHLRKMSKITQDKNVKNVNEYVLTIPCFGHHSFEGLLLQTNNVV